MGCSVRDLGKKKRLFPRMRVTMSSQACASVWWGRLTGSRLSGETEPVSGLLLDVSHTAWALSCLPSILMTPSEVGRVGVRLRVLAKISGDGCASY